MKTYKWIRVVIALMLMVCMIAPLNAQAVTNKRIQDESIYDLLVDRYFNKTIENDFEVDTRIPDAFAGGDFMGVVEKLDHIEKMGFTLISIGPIFSTDSYDGKRVVDYNTLERHFGTQEEFNTLINTAHEKNIGVITDFPIQNVSSEHVFTTDEDKASWVIDNADGTVSWDLTNEDAQQAILDAALTFIQEYNVDGLRLTAIEGIDTEFLNLISETLKQEKEDLYVLSGEPSEANFDAQILSEKEEMYRNAFKNVDMKTSQIAGKTAGPPFIQQIDSINSKRFTADAAEENMFPPTRWKMAMATLLSIPGVPSMTYGSEIAVNGEHPPESHPILNLKTDEKLIEFIGDIQLLRNKSSALRTGTMEMLHNEAGFMIYKRSNDDETWIVVINNTSGTQTFNLDREVIGDNKELRGLFENDILRQKDSGNYHLVVDREIAEFYIVNDNKGFNKLYIAALAVAYLLFLSFLYIVWRRKGKHRKSTIEKKTK
ncbi:alpha-amylase family glycosyl hydrolase [Paenisporosarcina sp. TG20]|uniref:alpha-amylase family glycosyl hydrolase n=1 Tax=Paenisporosarcina sp. TG20 TaxID=1211706 RepID=UPI00031240C9|nr:alpha-amylase family glycosyl hydrolase [Paenisporosarcina sp. TG20]